MIADRAGLDDGEVEELLDAILDQIVWVPDAAIEARIDPAAEALQDTDSKDVPYLACALAVEADGIWSRDTDFDQQELVERVEGPR